MTIVRNFNEKQLLHDVLAELEANDSVLANVADIQLTIFFIVVDSGWLHQLVVNLNREMVKRKKAAI